MKQKKELESLGFVVFGNEKLLKTAPQTTGEIEIFNVGKTLSIKELNDEYENRNLTPVNPLELAHYVLKSDKEFFATQWGGNIYCTFHRWRGERDVHVYRNAYDWHGYWWFAGVRKSSALEPKPSLDTLSLRVKSLEDDMDKLKKFLII